MQKKYTDSLLNYNRRKTNVVSVGNVPVGGENPIVLQTMTDTETLDIEATVNQCVRVVEAGAEIVRITTKGIEEAKCLTEIRSELNNRNIHVPIIADVHFNPKVAEYTAGIVDKVRINPGNYADKKTGKQISYTDAEYVDEILRIKERLLPLINICKENKTVLRIGTNHGSLSDRIMNRYGDTADGMCESVLEFLRICVAEDFNDIIISLKASNPVVMVQAYRLLVIRLAEEKMNFPLHLGVTEAGDDIMGRIKSAVGIGALLADGIGDTIRVSLTEPPENEIPVAKKLADHYLPHGDNNLIVGENLEEFYPDGLSFDRRKSLQILDIGGDNVPVVVGRDSEGLLNPEYFYISNEEELTVVSVEKIFITKSEIWNRYRNSYPNLFPVFSVEEYLISVHFSYLVNFIQLSLADLGENEEKIKKNLELISSDPTLVIILNSTTNNILGERRAFFMYLNKYACKNPVILRMNYQELNKETFIIKSAADSGLFFIDGLGDGLWLENENFDNEIVNSLSFDILQACRLRLTKPDYISCPGCGRTLFDLQETTAQIRKSTSHLKGLKIAIMGCIVNGPGEMADADYGYVGISTGKINLYKNKEVVKKNIPENQAVEELINLIKSSGDWHDQN